LGKILYMTTGDYLGKILYMTTGDYLGKILYMTTGAHAHRPGPEPMCPGQYRAPGFSAWLCSTRLTAPVFSARL